MSTAPTPFSTLDWTNKLVSFDTTSRGSNLALIETVRDYLRGVGLESHLTSLFVQSRVENGVRAVLMMVSLF